MLIEAEFNGTKESEAAPGWEKSQVHRYILYPKCHQGQSQEVVALGPLIITCEWGNNSTFILSCFNQINNNC